MTTVLVSMALILVGISSIFNSLANISLERRIRRLEANADDPVKPLDPQSPYEGQV